jgi:RES domain-containing protein
MKLYRLTKANYADDLSGTGGLYEAGRWHQQGTRLLYLSEHMSLAALEILANSDFLPKNYALITVELPEAAPIGALSVQDLPPDWKSSPAPIALAEITRKWINEGAFWGMCVPSAHSPTEFNYLLNPNHPEHRTLRIVSIEPYSFDERLK